jgi:uncharacterized protein YqeY
MRERLSESIKDAMRAKDSVRLSTLRLMAAALKDQDIAKRSEEGADALNEGEVFALFAKMVKQREESAKTTRKQAAWNWPSRSVRNRP